MESKIEQNKNYCVVSRRLIALFSSFVLCIMLLSAVGSFVAFAESSASSDSVDFSSFVLPVYTGDGLPSRNIIVTEGIQLSLQVGFIYPIYAISRVSDLSIYSFAVHDSSVANSDFTIYLASEMISGVSALFSATQYGNASSVTNSSLGRSNSDYNFVYTDIGSSSSISLVDSLPVFDSLNSGFSALRNFIDNGGSGGGDVLTNVNFTLPSGNIAYVDLGETTYNQSRHYRATTTFNGLSNIFNSQFGSLDKGTWGYSSSIPSSGSAIVTPSNRLGFVKTGSLNVLGQSSQGIWSQTSTATARYLVIYNPLIDGVDATDDSDYSLFYNVSIPDAVRVYVVPMSQGWNESGYYQDATPPKVGTPDENGNIVWTDESGGAVSAPELGGYNTPTVHGRTINEWLEQIANDISRFFQGAVGAITTLVNAGSDFIGSLGGLYAWLPGPVYSVLISALIVAITIGVIKVFL